MAGEGDGFGGVGGPLGLAVGRGDNEAGGGADDGLSSVNTSTRLYPCPDCDKVFRHPRSYYQHQHVHRGTHSCPGCRKLFSRRWDLLRHLNKNKYGCPARWREGGRHPPYRNYNSLSLSALASAAAVAATSQEGLPPGDPPDHQHTLETSLHAAPWTIASVSSLRHSSSSVDSLEPRPLEPPASTTSP